MRVSLFRRDRVLLLNLDGHSVSQVLAPGDDDIVSGLETADHPVIVARNLTQRERSLTRDFLTFLLFCDKRKELSADARNRHHRNRDSRLGAPGNACTYQLLR